MMRVLDAKGNLVRVGRADLPALRTGRGEFCEPGGAEIRRPANATSFS
jgi:hypothetical protein